MLHVLIKLLVCLTLSVIADETEIVQPFLLGCDTKSLRVVQISLTGLQRLINNEALSEVSIYTDCFWLSGGQLLVEAFNNIKSNII